MSESLPPRVTLPPPAFPPPPPPRSALSAWLLAGLIVLVAGAVGLVVLFLAGWAALSSGEALMAGSPQGASCLLYTSDAADE